jgi:hypothetical protein
MRLRSLLVSFRWRRSPTDLHTFEIAFSEGLDILSPQQRAYLQLEYASALWVLLQTGRTVHAWAGLEADRLARSNDSFTASPLFATDIIGAERLPRRPSLPRSSALEEWLVTYTDALIRLHLVPALSRNPARLVQYRIAPQVFPHLPRIREIAVRSLNRLLAQPADLRPRLCAQALQVFKVIEAWRYPELLLKCLMASFGADEFTIHRNASHIARACWACLQQGVGDPHELAWRADTLAAQLKVRRHAPVYGAYLAAAKYGLVTHRIEHEFVHQLWKAAGGTVFADSDQGARFTDRIILVARRFAEAGSLFAAVAANNLNNAEAWGTLGVAIMFRDPGREDLTYRKAALCFYYAVCFARQRGEFAQKDYYNYINARSLAILRGDEFDIGFVDSTLRYLSTRWSRLIDLRRDRLGEFLNLLREHWSALDEDRRRRAISTLRRRAGFTSSDFPGVWK